ncbi:hypothetical protein CASFOL_027193 [Castilleja foliolosa]|uniref:Uncharacterized protein n=1 Tax=Castilleja foliolosa TaxID=1961234 RepID=A0ABD3CF66_9LAMI
MADEFGAQELEDGEIWLPADFFSPDEVSDKTSSTCMDGFQRLSPSDLLLRQPHRRDFYKPPTLQRFKPAVRFGFGGVSGGGLGVTCDCGAGRSWTGCSPVYLNPVQNQIETFFMGERARAIQRQLQNRLVLNRISPRAGNVGTGVFLPRVSGDMAKNQNPRFVGKGPQFEQFARVTSSPSSENVAQQ